MKFRPNENTGFKKKFSKVFLLNRNRVFPVRPTPNITNKEKTIAQAASTTTGKQKRRVSPEIQDETQKHRVYLEEKTQ